MDKIYTVREFDRVASGEEYKSEDGYIKLPAETFTKLNTFIREFNADLSDTDALDLFSLNYNRNVGDYIGVKNYVGLVQFPSGEQIQILPKINLSSDNNMTEADCDQETMSIFLNMLRTLKSNHVNVFDKANLNVTKMNLYEFLIAMFVQEVKQLVRRGLKSNYVQREENIKVFKGKMLVNYHIRNNLCHKERFFVQYEEYESNTSENKLIKSTLQKLLRQSSDFNNKKNIRTLLIQFDEIEASLNFDKDFAKVVIDRNNLYYDSLIDWCKVFLYDKSFSAFSGKGQARSMLFTMHSIYESYVAKCMRSAYEEYGWEVSAQDTGFYLFDKPERFKLKPDIVIQRKGYRPIIMDTKWKQINNDISKNYNVGQGDMYQMYAYAQKYGAREIWLLYPWNKEAETDEDKVFITDDNNGNEIKVHIHMMKLDCMEDELHVLEKMLKWDAIN